MCATIDSIDLCCSCDLRLLAVRAETLSCAVCRLPIEYVCTRTKSVLCAFLPCALKNLSKDFGIYKWLSYLPDNQIRLNVIIVLLHFVCHFQFSMNRRNQYALMSIEQRGRWEMTTTSTKEPQRNGILIHCRPTQIHNDIEWKRIFDRMWYVCTHKTQSTVDETMYEDKCKEKFNENECFDDYRVQIANTLTLKKNTSFWLFVFFTSDGDWG